MKPQPISTITFGYSHKLKTDFKKGLLPNVKYGFYGEPINANNVTIEHLELASSFKNKKQATVWSNIVLTSADKNMERGAKPLSSVINFDAMGRYFEQFKAYSWGREYITKCMKTITKLLERGM